MWFVTAASASRRWWRLGTVGAAATWVHSVNCARDAARRPPPDAFIELRHEDLVAEPRAELERLCGFLGETSRSPC